MGVIQWISGQTHSQAARDIASLIPRDLSPAAVQSQSQMSASRITIILERAYKKAKSYDDAQHMNWIRRAQFANAFRWRLTEIGYNEKFVDLATEGLIVELSRKKSTVTAGTDK